MIEQKSKLTDDVPSADFGRYFSSITSEPLIKIQPRKKSAAEDLKEIWAYRELFFILVWRDVKARYKHTILGIGWAILQPALLTIVFTVFFGLVVRVPSDGLPYPLFAYSGMLVWLFFSQTILAGSQSLSSHANLINKVYFPRLIIPLVSVCVRLIDFLVAFTILGGLMFSYGISLSWSFLLFPILVIQLAVLAFGLSTILAVLNLKYRDVNSLLPILLQVWMFASPIVYPSSLIDENWRQIYFLNPIAAIVENLRASLFGLPFDTNNFLISMVVTLVLTIFSLWAFYAMSKDLADVF